LKPFSGGKTTEQEQPISGGALLSVISERIVGILREHYGRGPMRAKTYVFDDIIVCVLRDGYTAVEQTMMDSGEPQRVVQMRRDFQEMMGRRYKDAIEELTGREVIAFLSQAHVQPDVTIELFVLDEPVRGFGALEWAPGEEGQPERR
jgi:uncharacterized protein YbcI